MLGGHVLALRFTGLHEINIVLQQRGVEYAQNAVVVTDVGYGQHIFQRNGLTTNQIGTSLYAYKGYLFGSHTLNRLLQLLQVKITLEGVIALRQQPFLLHQFQHLTSAAGNVGLGGGKVEIHDGHHAGLYEGLGQDVLTGTSLVGRKQIIGAKHLFHSSLIAVEGFTAGIRVIGNVHGGGLSIRHSVHTAVGEHIHINVAILQQKGIVASFLNTLQALLYGE